MLYDRPTKSDWISPVVEKVRHCDAWHLLTVIVVVIIIIIIIGDGRAGSAVWEGPLPSSKVPGQTSCPCSLNHLSSTVAQGFVDIHVFTEVRMLP